MADPMRFVIVGSGNNANTYVDVIRKLPETRLVGIASRSGRKPSRLGDDPGVEVQTSLRDFKAPFDAVILATPNGLHHEGIIEGDRTKCLEPFSRLIHKLDANLGDFHGWSPTSLFAGRSAAASHDKHGAHTICL